MINLTPAHIIKTSRKGSTCYNCGRINEPNKTFLYPKGLLQEDLENMQSENIKRLMDEITESRKLHLEALNRVQRSVYAFKKDLANAKWHLQTTAQRFSDLVQEPEKVQQEAIIIEMHRRAS